MQIAWRQYPAVNRRTRCEHAWWYWECATLNVKQVVHSVEVNMLKILEARGVNQVSKSETRGGEEAQDHQDASAEREKIRPPRREANYVIRQMETPQIGDSGEFSTLTRRSMCPWCPRDRFQQPRPSTDSGDSRCAVCRHRGQHLCEHAEPRADGAEVRRSCTDTALDDEIAEVPAME